MKHTYTITGMSCDGCRGKVEKTLNAIKGVEAIVSLEPPVATITMDKHIPTSQLQEALAAAGNYSIEMSQPVVVEEKTTEEPAAKSCCGTTKDQQDKDSHQHHKDIVGISENVGRKILLPYALRR